IEPQHTQLAAVLAAVAGDGTDRADGEAVIAAEHDRHPAVGEFSMHRVMYCAVPLGDFGEVTEAFNRRQLRVRGPGQVAAVAHVRTEGGDRAAEASYAHRLRPHA